MDDLAVIRHCWEGHVPVIITLSATEIASLDKPSPFYMVCSSWFISLISCFFWKISFLISHCLCSFNVQTDASSYELPSFRHI